MAVRCSINIMFLEYYLKTDSLGIMAILFCGIVMSHYTHFNLSPSSQITVQLAFRTIAFLSGTDTALFDCMVHILSCCRDVCICIHRSRHFQLPSWIQDITHLVEYCQFMYCFGWFSLSLLIVHVLHSVSYSPWSGRQHISAIPSGQPMSVCSN